MDVTKLIFGGLLVFGACSAALAVESIRALKRGARQQAGWTAGSAICMLSTGLAIWLLHGRFVSPWTPQLVALIIFYIMFYCALKAQRLHLGAPSAFKMSMTVVAAGFAANVGVLIYLSLSSEPLLALVLMDPLPVIAALATMVIEIWREEAVVKRQGEERRTE